MYCGVKTNLVNFQLEVARLFENLLTLSKLWAFRNGKSIKTRHPDSLLESNVCFETVELKTIISNSSTMNQHIFSILAQKKWKIESNINVRGNCAASYNCHCPPINCHGQRKDPEQQASFLFVGENISGFICLKYIFSLLSSTTSQQEVLSAYRIPGLPPCKRNNMSPPSRDILAFFRRNFFGHGKVESPATAANVWILEIFQLSSTASGCHLIFFWKFARCLIAKPKFWIRRFFFSKFPNVVPFSLFYGLTDFVWVSMQVALLVVVSLVPHFAALACGQNPFIQLMIYLRPLLLVISPF